ncbi:hypothetical protein JL721_611 [Aureococcus anophagefferens]|nr:hypothetical protein JL721_611 [Aureococcus anophagefferens]
MASGVMMRINATVEYGVQRRRIVVPCGDGRKSVKWLGLVAAQRFIMDAAARGKTRLRDRRSVAPAATQLIPSGVSTADEPFFHPAALLCDVFEDGAEVAVALEPKVAVGASGRPLRSNWAVVAFSTAPASEPARRAALEDEYRKREARLAKMKRETKEKQELDNYEKGSAMRKMIGPQLLQMENLDPAVDGAWAEMNRQGLMDQFIRNPRDQDKVRRILRDHFLELSELFKFYSAGTQNLADAHQLEFSEFCTFARDVGVFGPGGFADHALLNVCFAEACEIPPQQVKSGHMELYQFLTSLIWLAQVAQQATAEASKAKKGALALIAGGGHERKKSMITRQGVAKHGFMSTADMLRTFIDTRVALALKKQATQLIGIVTKECLNTDAVLARFYEHHDALLGVYMTYLPSKPPGKAEKMDLLEGYMTMAEFQVLIEDSTLLRSQGDDDELTLKEVRQAFAGAQTDIDLDSGDLAPKKAPKRKDAPKGNLSSAQLMSYAEFLEAVLRLAMLKWEADEHDADARGASNFNRG